MLPTSLISVAGVRMRVGGYTLDQPNWSNRMIKQCDIKLHTLWLSVRLRCDCSLYKHAHCRTHQHQKHMHSSKRHCNIMRSPEPCLCVPFRHPLLTSCILHFLTSRLHLLPSTQAPPPRCFVRQGDGAQSYLNVLRHLPSDTACPLRPVLQGPIGVHSGDRPICIRSVQ